MHAVWYYADHFPAKGGDTSYLSLHQQGGRFHSTTEARSKEAPNFEPTSLRRRRKRGEIVITIRHPSSMIQFVLTEMGILIGFVEALSRLGL